MRDLTSHAINHANEAIRVIALDEPGSGGANHKYAIVVPALAVKVPAEVAYAAYGASTGNKNFQGNPMPAWADLPEAIKVAWQAAALALAELFTKAPCLMFQNGPVKENGEGVNGITHEALIAILIDRLEGFQAGQYANKFNEMALQHLSLALDHLNARTREREARGVEGTHQL